MVNTVYRLVRTFIGLLWIFGIILTQVILAYIVVPVGNWLANRKKLPEIDDNHWPPNHPQNPEEG